MTHELSLTEVARLQTQNEVLVHIGFHRLVPSLDRLFLLRMNFYFSVDNNYENPSLLSYLSRQWLSKHRVAVLRRQKSFLFTVVQRNYSQSKDPLSIMPSGARANDQYQYKLSMAEQIEELRKKRELLGIRARSRRGLTRHSSLHSSGQPRGLHRTGRFTNRQEQA